MLKRLTLLAFVAFAATLPSLLFPSAPEASVPVVEHLPAIKLMPNWNGPVTYAIASVAGGKVVDLQLISEKDFIMIYSGSRRHVANPQGTNLFEANGISNCYVEYDKVERKHYQHCQSVENLWRLRFKKNPHDAGDLSGWTRLETAPDKAQIARLQEFGLSRLTDFIMGDNVWNLIRSTDDPSWVASYR